MQFHSREHQMTKITNGHGSGSANIHGLMAGLSILGGGGTRGLGNNTGDGKIGDMPANVGR
jgi:hypothetical protein